MSVPPTVEEESPCKLLSLITGTGGYFTGPLKQKGDYVLRSVGFEMGQWRAFIVKGLLGPNQLKEAPRCTLSELLYCLPGRGGTPGPEG